MKILIVLLCFAMLMYMIQPKVTVVKEDLADEKAAFLFSATNQKKVKKIKELQIRSF